MRQVLTRHGPVAVFETGRGPVLLLLHANPGDHRDFDAIVPALSRTHRVVAIDWPGYGESRPPGGGASAMCFAEALIDVADGLELRDARVMGCSVGGYAAVRLALERPERVGSLVLVAPGGFTRPNAFTRAFCWLKGREWVSRLVAGRFARMYLRVRNEHVSAILARTDEGARVESRVAVDAGVWRSFNHAQHDLRDAARAVAVPVLLTWGVHDPVLRVRTDGVEALRAMPHAVLETFDTGHMPFAEAPERFLEIVTPFLEGTRALARVA